jgi:hypothetical protein
MVMAVMDVILHRLKITGGAKSRSTVFNDSASAFFDASHQIFASNTQRGTEVPARFTHRRHPHTAAQHSGGTMVPARAQLTLRGWILGPQTHPAY